MHTIVEEIDVVILGLLSHLYGIDTYREPWVLSESETRTKGHELVYYETYFYSEKCLLWSIQNLFPEHIYWNKVISVWQTSLDLVTWSL